MPHERKYQDVMDRLGTPSTLYGKFVYVKHRESSRCSTMFYVVRTYRTVY
jgi:hypothetical protein